MESGNVVYLCEDLFSKFRDYFDWMKSGANPYCNDVKTKRIENKFQLILGIDKTNQAFITIVDDLFDRDLGSATPSFNNIKFNSEINHVYISFKNEFINFEDIRHMVSSPGSFYLKKFKRKCFVFKVPFDKLTKIEGL